MLTVIVSISENFQYTAADYNYTPSVASKSEYGSEYGANFIHAFANPKQEFFADPRQAAILAGPLIPLVATAVVVSILSAWLMKPVKSLW